MSAEAGWQARLELDYAHARGRTTLFRRSHSGPLAVQKSLYPEGQAVCHTLLLHPPGGLVAGDTLAMQLNLAADSRVLVTTPGAGKWYRAATGRATQTLRARLEPGAVLEWLPQENIIFNGAVGGLHAEIDLAAGACYLGWDIICFGRTASGERFGAGELKLSSDIRIAGLPVWSERGRVAGGSPVLDSPVGLNGAPVTALLLAAGRNVPPELLAACRAVKPAAGEAGITVMDALLAARYAGPGAEDARTYFIALWRLLRPALTGLPAALPRIWST